MKRYTRTKFSQRDGLNKTLYLVQFLLIVILPAGFVGLAAFKIQQDGLFQLDVAWTDFAFIGLLANIGFYIFRMFSHFPYTFPSERIPALKAVLEILLHFALIIFFTRSQSLVDALSIFGLIVIQASALYTLYIITVLGLGQLFRYVFLRKKDRDLTSFITVYILLALITLPVFAIGLIIVFILCTGVVISLIYSIPLYIKDATGAFALLLLLQYFIALVTVYTQTGRVNAVFISDQQNEQLNSTQNLSS
ncbi:MAG: hypothetical protein QM496_02615 [Verrucomicrobiota bacterium]